MSYTFKQDYVGSHKFSIKCPYSMTPQYITIHNTSNSATAQAEITYMKNNNNQTSFHVCVDEKYVIQAIPFNRNAWHAGDGANGTGNRKSIGIEIARSTGDINLFKKAEQNCAEYVATLLKKNGWGIDRVKRHKDWSGKNCPHKTMELGWQRFLNMIQAELNKLNKPATSTAIKVGDRVKVKTSASNYADSYKTIPSWVRGSVYTVSKVLNSKVLLKEITSWVNIKDVEKVSTKTTSTSTNSYKVEITTSSLNVRAGAGVGYKITGVVRKGEVYTIVQTSNGWGKLKSGLGWINLSYSKRI